MLRSGSSIVSIPQKACSALLRGFESRNRHWEPKNRIFVYNEFALNSADGTIQGKRSCRNCFRCQKTCKCSWGIAKSGKPVLIILGNEEDGISDVVKNNCDELVIIPWAGMNTGVTESVIDSLNAAQASSIIFYELTK